MSTPPANELMERPIALSQLREHNQSSANGSEIRRRSSQQETWLAQSQCGATFHVANSSRRGAWCHTLLMLLAVLLCGCGSPPDPNVLTPRELKTDAAKLSLIRFSSDGSYLAAGSADGEVIVWSDISIPPTKFDSGHHAPLVSATWALNNLLTVTDLDNGFVGWQFGKAEPSRIDLPGLPAPAVCVAFRPKTNPLEFVIGSRDGSLIFLESKIAKQLKPDHRGAVKQIAYTPDGRSLITAGADGKLVWREAASRKILESIKAHDAEISRLVLSRDGKQFITGDWNGRIKLWDTSTHKTLHTFEQTEAVSGLGWVQGQVVSASWDGSLRLWNITSGQLLRTIPTGQPIHDLSVDPRTERIATVCLDRSVRLWELPK